MVAWVTGLALILFMTVPAFASDSLTVAVAPAFKRPFTEIARRFEAAYPVKIVVTYAPTGVLYSQIVNGAPYDVFLAADERRPAMLAGMGFAEKPVTYAVGRVVLWSRRAELCRTRNWQSVLTEVGAYKIAIVSGATSPYGESAENAIRKEGLWDALKPRFVYAQDVAQAFQYVFTGAAAAGFCALSDAVSAVGREGCHIDVAEAPPVVHSACVLKRSKNREAARRFVEFLRSPEAEKIKQSYGYR